jgi:probable H4MPT-linked C1 transfer pathway protein
VAAANWHALATWSGRVAPQGAALLLDCGSTTTDVIPILDGIPGPEGRTDVERLLSGELVYMGVRRTPLCAVASAVPYRGRECPLAAEMFATSLDIYLLLGEIPESVADRNTADGRPATRASARARLSRSLCCDSQDFTDDDVHQISRFLAQAVLNRLGSAIHRVLERIDRRCGMVLISGEGAFVLQQVISTMSRLKDATVLALDRVLGPEHSRAACSFALARLLRERIRPASAADLLN